MNNCRRSLLCLLFAIAAGGAIAADAASPLDRTLRLDLWGVGFDDVRIAIQEQTGVKLVVYTADFAADGKARDIYLVTGRVRLRAVLECLAARLSFRYRVSEAGRIELSRGYGWLAGEPVLRFLPLDRLSGRDATREETLALLAEAVKPLSQLADGYSIDVEPYPTPDNPRALRCAAALPPVLAGYLERVVRCLSDDAGDAVPDAGRADLFAVADAGDPRWRELLARQVTPPAGNDLRGLLVGVAEQAGVAIILPPPASSPVRPASGPAGERATLGWLTGDLAARWGLGGRTLLAAGAIVFAGGADGDLVMDSRSRELFLTGLAVAGFDAAAAAERAGGGDALAARIRREVYPEVWRDPTCAVAFSRVTGRLVVVAPRNVVREVAARFFAGR